MLKNKPDLINAILNEIRMRSAELSTEVKTVYFGGGTPSVLSEQELFRIMQSVRDYTDVSTSAEITLEANPDDIDPRNLEIWQKNGINRLSIGLQTFDDRLLKWMNRSHTGAQSVQCVADARKAGFSNISVDLIYGLPEYDNFFWADQLKQVLELGVPHVSAYALTVEDKTALHKQVQQGNVLLPDEETVSAQFIELRNRLGSNGFEQYEVSNFAKEGYISRHNSAYWHGQHYIGIGPSAHSYNGTTRRWNVANNTVYMKRVGHETFWEEEELSEADRFNEYLLTRLRTKWGVSINDLKRISGSYTERFLDNCGVYEAYYTREKDTIVLNREGLLIADRIASDLFIVD